MEINFIKEIQNLETEIKTDKLPTSASLIKQTFLVWYLLVEGSGEIEEEYLINTLHRNIDFIKKFYQKEPELLFIQGWMMNISPWYFNLEDSVIGNKYLKLAYKYNPENLLFEWAVSDLLNISKATSEGIEKRVLNNMKKYYIDYLPIQKYFKNIVGRR